MCEAGRIRHHLKHNLWRSESTILFVGYQSEGTVGRLLLDGADEVKLFNEKVIVKAHIEQMDGISGHGDKDIMLNWLEGLSPKTVFVNHGEDRVVDSFAKEINQRFGYNAIAPYNGAVYDLQSGECLYEGNKTPLEGKKKVSLSPEYQRLVKEGRKLSSLIESYKNRTEEKISSFANAVHEFIRKWE